jgi:drug/metabolite transporter (DMT)-like permease
MLTALSNNGLSNNAKGLILGLISFAVFSVADAGGKWLTQSYTMPQIVGWEGLFALLCIAACAPFMGGYRLLFQTQRLDLHIGRAVCNLSITALIVLAFAHLQLATIYTLLFISPFISTLLAIPLFKEKVSIHGWAAIAVGFAGVLVIVRPGLVELNLWLLLPLVITLFIAGLWLFSRALPENENLLTLAVYPALFNFAVMLPISLYMSGMPALSDIPIFAGCGAMIMLGLITGATAFRIAKTSVVSPLHYTQMVWGIILGYLLFGDVPDMWTWAGAALIIGSGIYLLEIERRE